MLLRFWQKLHSVLPRLCTASLSHSVRDAASGHLSQGHTEKKSGARAGTERLSLCALAGRSHVPEQPEVDPHTSGLAGREGE